jgi:putative SOS response-associated peptidase YedK
MTEIAKQFGVANELPLFARYNIAPTQSVPVVRVDNGQRILTTMQWGLIPSWAKDTKIGYKMINA